jgi:DNA (cytosine-5)-methyltransferase 1
MTANLKMIELFAGIRSFSLASSWIGGFETVEAVEINSYCNQKMLKHYPNVPIYEDIRTYSPQIPTDLIVGGSPCQDLSSQGKQAGIEGDRSSLWYEMLRVIKEARPRFVIWENVRNAIAKGAVHEVMRGLYSSGYRFDAQIISAEEIGAPHQRERVFVVAYAHGAIKTTRGKVLESWSEQIGSQIAIARTFDNWQSSQLSDNGVDHGVPDRLAGLSAYGNSIVPQCAVVPLLRVKYLAESMAEILVEALEKAIAESGVKV